MLEEERGLQVGRLTLKNPLMVQVFPLMRIKGRDLLVGRLNLKDPLKIQALHLTRVGGRDITRTAHEMNFRKAKPPTFNGEVKTGQEAEAWLLGIRKYFQVQDYSGNMKARVAIFNLMGRASIWWEHFRKLKKKNERNIL